MLSYIYISCQIEKEDLSICIYKFLKGGSPT